MCNKELLIRNHLNVYAFSPNRSTEWKTIESQLTTFNSLSIFIVSIPYIPKVTLFLCQNKINPESYYRELRLAFQPFLSITNWILLQSVSCHSIFIQQLKWPYA
ncbi:hypothetical protein L6164_031480 [Bauhinia variegata]|uniref:Uncharacterized protein n=1 Tax=Bauhinia variegata TaxID=167791 RepID=A0ACB9LFQ3_BAUVA|nr:hypothetical protein L6164_031480 [Bauhinia variegata]